MDIELASGLAVPTSVWLPALLCLAAFGTAFFFSLRTLRRAEQSIQDARRVAAKDHERADIAARELAAEQARIGPLAAAHHRLTDGLLRGFQDLTVSKDRSAAVATLAQIVQRVFQPKQFLLFIAVDREGKEFQLAYTGGQCGTWAKGARISDATGRLGLVARRRIAMDNHQFELEPPIVRDQVDATEPKDFHIDVAVPIIVGSSVVALVSIGGSSIPADASRGGLQILAAYTAVTIRAVDAAAKIERYKNTDEMTGLHSKSWFVAEGAEALYRCRTEDLTAAVVLFGVDDFRAYVERAGHKSGDALLAGVGEVLRKYCTSDALLARWSGGEFVVMLPGATAPAAHAFADRVRAAIGAVNWPLGAEQRRGRLTLSAGLAFLPSNGLNLDTLIEAAAESLTSARWNGDTTSSAAAELLRSGDDAAEEYVSDARESGQEPSN